MKINLDFQLDFRLFDVSLELHALEDHYELIEKQISHLIHTEKVSLDEYRKNGDIGDDRKDGNRGRAALTI